MNINARNISILIHFMEGLNDPRFTMRQFGHDCNTPACALGWACRVPELQAAGLEFKTVYEAGTACVAMSDRVFGNVYLPLFSGMNAFGCGHIETPQQWAVHARKFLADKGLKVVPADNGFKALMQSVLKTVALEETGTTRDRSDKQDLRSFSPY